MERKIIARFVTRDAGRNKSENDGLILGAILRNAAIEFFKPNTVYSLISIDGHVMMIEEGESCGHLSEEHNGEKMDYNKYCFSWGSDFSKIPLYSGNQFVLTMEEWQSLKKQRSEDGDK